MSDEPDLGLETILAVTLELGSELDAQLIKACFEIQKKYQFNNDRTLSTQAMNRIIEGQVDRAADTAIKVRG